MIAVSNSEIPEWKQRLLDGYQSFRDGHYLRERELYEQLGEQGQSPKVLLIGCADSRADPGAIFDSGPGEMFVVRNVANLVPPKDETAGYHGTSAALEFAVEALKVQAIVVMGHESCGGIMASLGEVPKPHGYVDKWISILDQTRDEVVARTPAAEQQRALEYEGVRQSLRNLMTFDCVARRVDDGSLELLGAYFSIIRGVLKLADGPNGEFREVPASQN